MLKRDRVGCRDSAGSLLAHWRAAAKKASNLTMMTQLVQCALVAGAPLHDALVPPQRLQANETLVTIDGSPISQPTIRTATRVMIDGSTALHRLPETFVSFTMEASIASSYDLDL